MEDEELLMFSPMENDIPEGIARSEALGHAAATSEPGSTTKQILDRANAFYDFLTANRPQAIEFSGVDTGLVN